jgi:hypothetical protein
MVRGSKKVEKNNDLWFFGEINAENQNANG